MNYLFAKMHFHWHSWFTNYHTNNYNWVQVGPAISLTSLH